ncbi:hypothetical protein WJX81_006936 [Elliptochloris bilobata]|uniref:Transferrin-binding protein B C-lobe/N-lobe beta barrel domain-containing protein n=1 Tax=Elliptochloris bilobata TaxID=381761 RepID=A0AAW1QK01_9CHLO
MGRFVGNGEFSGGGVFTLDNSTFVGVGTFKADMGVITTSSTNSSCNGSAAFFTKDLHSQAPAQHSSGVHWHGSFAGKGMHFTGGDGSFEGDPGVLVGKGSASGKSFTCWGEGTYQGTGTVEGTGTLYGQGTLDGWAEMVAASGTFQGPMGVCGGPTANAA